VLVVDDSDITRADLGAKATTSALVSLADQRLYEAKAAGRNRVCP
jgi:PleD family two-component response regulator